MLSDFFRINLPYGLARNKNGEWMAFNREYMPLGFNSKDHRTDFFPEKEIEGSPIYTRYRGLTEKVLLSIAARDGESVRRDEKGEVYEVWLYHDGTNPMNQSSKSNPYWKEYWAKLEILSKLQRK
ncbi:hypothetical protein [uncultured Draconibacterium sp.]|uniref:hypothetical protein n=1 Tax=uncultured Draconibacterium sp. TaxID=1573823 RepID=UPI0029C79952|nr:hypothetical protein [uncultured Draconibacterium sp.]